MSALPMHDGESPWNVEDDALRTMGPSEDFPAIDDSDAGTPEPAHICEDETFVCLCGALRDEDCICQ